MLPYRFAALLVFALAGCASSTYAPRPYRFDAPANVGAETHRLAQRMSGRTETKPALVDPNTGTIYAAWRMTGVSASITLFPPGERRAWLLQRYRAFVRPNGWASTVYVDLEQMECETRGFSWSELEVRGNCRPITEMTAEQLRALDATAASLGG